MQDQLIGIGNARVSNGVGAFGILDAAGQAFEWTATAARLPRSTS